MSERKVKIIEKYNDALAHVYDKATLGEFQWAAPQEANKLILPYIKPGFSVLDVGIGTGQSAEELFKVGCTICGIDISAKMLEITKQKFPAFDLYQADIAKGLPELRSRTFDVVMAIGVLEFLHNIDKTLKMLANFLKSSGFLCFTFEEYLPKHQLQQWRRSQLGKGVIEPVPELLTFLNYRHTPPEIERIVGHHDLELLEKRQFNAYLKSKEKIPIYYGIILARKIDKHDGALLA